MKDFNEVKTILPYHLQFFAENPAEPLTEPDNKPAEPAAPSVAPPTEPDTPPAEPQLSAEEQIAKLMAKVKALESKSDKSASDAAAWKKKYNATLSEKEQLDNEKAEREAAKETELQELRRERDITKLEKNYLTLGYDAKLATQAATAQIDGDTDEVFRISQLHQANLMKKLQSDWMKNAPTPPAGNKDTKTDAFAMGFDKG